MRGMREGVDPRVRRRQGPARAARPAVPAGVAEPYAAARSGRRRGERAGAGAGDPRQRSERNAPIVEELREREREGRPNQPLADRARATCTRTSTGSTARRSGRTNWRSTTSSHLLYESRAARERKGERPAKVKKGKGEPEAAAGSYRCSATSVRRIRSHSGRPGSRRRAGRDRRHAEPVRKPGSARQASSSPAPTTHISNRLFLARLAAGQHLLDPGEGRVAKTGSPVA